MDLSRWNIPHLSKIRDRIGERIGERMGDIRDLRDFLGDVLEGERELLIDPSKTKSRLTPFEVSDDFEELDHSLALLKPNSSPEKILAEFAPYFEGALCLTAEKGVTQLTSVVLFGQTFLPPDKKGSALGLGLGDLRSGTVYKGRSRSVLESLKLQHLSQLRDADAFAFSPADGVVFVLFCSRPHPWQVLAIESAYLSARDTLHRKSPSKTGGRSLSRDLGLNLGLNLGRGLFK